jgi:hypothetical protein
MKIRTLTEREVQRCWTRLLGLQARGYVFRIKRRGKVVALLKRPKTTIFSRVKSRDH